MLRENTVIARLVRDYDPESDDAKFFADPKNQKKILQGLRDSTELSRCFHEATRIDWELFHRPATI